MATDQPNNLITKQAPLMDKTNNKTFKKICQELFNIIKGII